MYLTQEDVRGIASYTRIALGDDEIVDLTTDLNAIVDSLKPITQFDLSNVEPTYHPIAGLVNVMRDDLVKPGLDSKDALSLAPATEEGLYRIPSILGEGS